MSSAERASVSDYVQQHNIHLLLDRMVKDILTERPQDSDSWMLRWFLEQHRLECEEKHRHNSPQHVPAVSRSPAISPVTEALQF